MTMMRMAMQWQVVTAVISVAVMLLIVMMMKEAVVCEWMCPW